MPTDNEFNAGELSLVVDDYNPGCDCLCLPGCYKRLTLTAKVALWHERKSCFSFKSSALFHSRLLHFDATLDSGPSMLRVCSVHNAILIS